MVSHMAPWSVTWLLAMSFHQSDLLRHSDPRVIPWSHVVATATNQIIPDNYGLQLISDPPSPSSLHPPHSPHHDSGTLGTAGLQLLLNSSLRHHSPTNLIPPIRSHFILPYTSPISSSITATLRSARYTCPPPADTLSTSINCILTLHVSSTWRLPPPITIIN